MSGKGPIYLDYNATTPVDPRVLEEMLPWFTEKFGNAASVTHPYGWAAREATKMSREKIAAIIGADKPETVVFTSGSTEGVNLAIKGVMEMYAFKGDHLITCETEHSAVKDAVDYLERTGKRVTRLPVDKQGMINPQDLRAAITDKTMLVSIMFANNETGVIQPIQELSEIAHEHGAIFMSDATQAVGKLPIHVEEMGIDLLVFSAHKFYGPKGMGGLFVRRRRPRVVLTPLQHGGGHEHGYRSGTLNVPGIVGMAKALEIASEEMEAEGKRLKALRDDLEQHLLALGDIEVNGHPEKRLPNTCSLRIGGLEAEQLIMSMHKVAISTGSACTSASMEPSHVLKAMQLTHEEAYGSIRISLGRFTTEAEIAEAKEVMASAILRLRAR